MNNQTLGSVTNSVAQNASTFPESTTPSLQDRAERSAARFLKMAQSVIRHDAPPPVAHSRPKEARREAAEGIPTAPPVWMVTEEELTAAVRQAQQWMTPAQVRVKVRAQQLPPLADLVDLEALRPTRGRGAGSAGAGALAALLYDLVRHVLTVRPKDQQRGGRGRRQVVLHLSAEMLAAILGCNDATSWRWTQQLEALGFLHARPHFTTTTSGDGERRTVVDGTVYAVRLEADHCARLTYHDLKRQYRDLDADRAAGRTAHAAILQARREAANCKAENADSDAEHKMQGSVDSSLRTSQLYMQLKQWAVTPGQYTKNPLTADACIFQPDELGEALTTIQDVIYTLPLLAEAHTTKRAPLVGILATTLARTLSDQHSRAWYCKLIWAAWRADLEGRAGLQVLAAQLARLDVDRHEWAELRRPAALLTARLRAA